MMVKEPYVMMGVLLTMTLVWFFVVSTSSSEKRCGI